jgi:hypothetical protein
MIMITSFMASNIDLHRFGDDIVMANNVDAMVKSGNSRLHQTFTLLSNKND